MADKSESTIHTIMHLKRQDPFAPFLIVMASGDRYQINDPDALAIASTQLHYYPRSGMGIHLRINQIASVEEEGEKPKRRRVG
jgi:hypothetical protein